MPSALATDRRRRVVVIVRRPLRLGDLLAVLEPAELHRLRHFLAVAHDDDFDILADRRRATIFGRSRDWLTSLPSNLTITSAGLEAGMGPLVVDAGDQCARALPRLEAFGDRIVDVLDAHAEPAAPRLAELCNCSMIGDALGIAKPMPTEPPDGERDRGVDADHVAVHVEQRTAGIALVDGGVGLDVIVVGTAVDVAVARRHDAGCHRCRRGRTGCRFAITQSPTRDVGIAEFHRRSGFVGLHAQHRDVDLRIPCRDLGLQLLCRP